MFRLASLECPGCRYYGSSNPYYDDEIKRPCFSECGHSLCRECIDKFTTCPICDKEIKKIENYAARILLEEYKKDPMKVFKNWWNATGDEQETCTKCFESSAHLRFCITCYSSKLDFLVVYGEPDKEKLWLKNKRKLERRKQIEEFQRKSLYTEIDPEADPEEIDLKIHFQCDFYLFANLACCPSCVLDHHDGHLVNTKDELESTMEVFKQSAATIATRFLAEKVYNTKSLCKLKTMRLHRTIEKLSHYASNYFRSPECVFRVPDIHLSRRSRLNRFFDPIPWENLDNVTREDVNEIIASLDYQMSHIECEESCNCDNIWNEMHGFSFGNQVEKTFVQTIENLGNQEVSKCPFPGLEFQKTRDKAVQEIPENYVPDEDKEIMDLVNFCKSNCIELFQEWWSCEPSQLEFCLNCSSYSESLEVCVFCELDSKESALRTNQKSVYSRSDSLFYNYKGLKSLPIRWQCADCNERLIEDWVHRPNEDSLDGLTWKRGCNHLKSRISRCKLSMDNKCSFNAIELKEIDGYNIAIKVATMDFVYEIMRTAVNEKVECEFEKMRFLKSLGVLKTKMKHFFLNSFEKGRSEKTHAEISKSIEKFEMEWSEYQRKSRPCPEETPTNYKESS